jgi:hypothetical protein
VNARLVALGLLVGCWTGTSGSVGPASGDDLDLVMPGSTYIAAIDVAHSLHAPIVTPYRDLIGRAVGEVTASLPAACKFDLLGSLQSVVVGARDGGVAGSLVAHGLPSDRLRTCLVSSGGAPVAVVRDGVYRVAVADTEVEIRLVDQRTTWVRWAPHGSLGEPSDSRADPYDLRRLLARVDRSATMWAVMKPTATELRDSWPDKDMPPPIALAASVRLDDRVAVDVEYRTASPAAARDAADQMRTRLQLASRMLRLDVSMHADGDLISFHGAASADTVRAFVQIVDSFSSFVDEVGSAGGD